MSESSVIKEFLVSLGVKKDEAGFQKFEDSIASATKLTLGLGAALESMAATAMFAAQRIAMSYANLQTESRNVGASAENIKTYTYAVSQLGGTVEEALGSIQTFARKLRESPGQIALLETFIGRARDAKGQLLDTTELMDRLLNSERFNKHPEHVRRKYLQDFGISENTWRALTDPKSRDFLEESRRVNQNYGLDPDKLAKQGREFTQEWQAIWLRIRAIRDRFLMGLGFEDSLKKFKDYLDQNKDQINEGLDSFVKTVKPFIIAFGDAAKEVARFAGAILKWLGPNTTAWLAVAALVNHFTGLGRILAVTVIPAVYRLATALGALLMGSSGAAIRALGGLAGFFGAPAVAAILGGAAALYPSPAGEGEDERQRQENIKRDPDYYKPGHPGYKDKHGATPDAKEQKPKSRWERTKDWFKRKVGIEAEARETVEGQKGGETPARGRTSSVGSWWTPERQKYAVEYLMKHAGLSEWGAAGLVARWAAIEAKGGPSSVNPHSGAFGIAQWLGRRKPGIAGNTDFEAQLAYAARELNTTEQNAASALKSAKNAAEARRGASMFERAEGYNPETGRDYFTNRTPAAEVYGRVFDQSAPDEEAQPQRNNAARRMADARRASRERARPEVEPQTPVHIPERRRTREDERWERRPRYDYSRPGAPLRTPTPNERYTSRTPGVDLTSKIPPRTPIGHVSHTNSVRHGDMNAKTTINVSTPGDPGAAARAIAGIQNNVNADLVRNMRGAAR